jgi:hypothetical protein
MNGTDDGRAARAGALLTAVLLLAGLGACGGSHRLADYDFSGRTVAVTYFPAPAPELRTGRSGRPAEGEDALSVVLTAGSRIVREVEARRARARLDSAATRVELAGRMAERTLERSARYLGASPVAEAAGADFVLEVDIRTLGLEAGADRAWLFVSGEAILLDGRTGAEIWAMDVRGYDPLTPDVDGGGVLPEDVLTAGALSGVSVSEFERLLERLGDYAADRISRELRENLRDVRRDR